MDDMSDFSADAINGAVNKAYGLPQPKQQSAPLVISTSGTSTSQRQSPFDAALQAEGVTGKKADFMRSIYQQESTSGKNTATSNAGAVGPMQVTPAAFSDVADKGWSINNPIQNLRSGIRYASQMYDKAGGDPSVAAAGYYGGGGGLTKAQNGVAVSDPRNPGAPNTLQYGAQVAGRMPQSSNQLDNFDDFSSSAINSAVNSAYGKTSQADQIPGIAGGNTTLTQDAPESLWDKAKNALAGSPVGLMMGVLGGRPGMNAAQEAALSVGGSMGAGVIGAGAGALHGLANVNQGAQGVRNAENFGANISDALTPQPSTQTGRNIVQGVGDVMNNSGVMGLAPIAEMQALGHSGKPSAGVPISDITQKAPARIEPTLKPRIKLNTDGSQMPINSAGQPIQAAAGGDVLAGVGAARVNSNPYSALTGQETVRGDYPQVKATKIGADVPSAEQQQRATIANQILGDVGKVRSGVVTGNLDTLKNEHLLANSPNPTPQGLILKKQFADEQSALSQYAKDRVDATGASPTLQNDYQRGQFVNDVMTGEDGVKGYLDGLKKQVYDQAAKTVGNNPISTSNIDALANDPKFQAQLKISGNKDFTSGLSDLIDQMKTTGFENAPPNSVAAMEELRKSLNQQWSPSNRYFIGKAVSAIDDDVAKAGGPGLFEQGRAIHQTEKTLFGSKGIKTLFGDVDPNGVQTATPFEKIPDKLNNLPIDQWSHVHNTLDSLSRGQIPGAPENMPALPKEIQQAAAQARNEVSGMLARKVYEAGADKIGVWNQNSANNVLNSSIGDKIKIAMPPDEVNNFHTLNLGGQIMPGDMRYEGAGNQLSRMGKQGLIEKHAGAVGAVLGGLTGGSVGSWIATKTGEKIGAKAGINRQIKQAQQLSNTLESNSKMGSTSLYDISRTGK